MHIGFACAVQYGVAVDQSRSNYHRCRYRYSDIIGNSFSDMTQSLGVIIGCFTDRINMLTNISPLLCCSFRLIGIVLTESAWTSGNQCREAAIEVSEASTSSRSVIQCLRKFKDSGNNTPQLLQTLVKC